MPDLLRQGYIFYLKKNIYIYLFCKKEDKLYILFKKKDKIFFFVGGQSSLLNNSHETDSQSSLSRLDTQVQAPKDFV